MGGIECEHLHLPLRVEFEAMATFPCFCTTHANFGTHMAICQRPFSLAPSSIAAPHGFRLVAQQQGCLYAGASVSAGSAIANNQGQKRGWRRKFAQEGVPQELLEDSKFVQIKDEDPRFGPPAMLLLGFRHEEIIKVEEFLKEIDGEFLKILLCTNEMIIGTLWDAINSTQANLRNVEIPKGLPRICFLSGLTGEEIILFVQRFPEIGLESTAFAALVPKNAGKSLEELVEEVMDDHTRLSGNSRH